MERGILIALEGIDGAGKSRLAAGLVAALRARGHDVVATREPTDGPTGRKIRHMAGSNERVAPAEELEWFMRDRAEHVEHVIEPALAAGRIVLTDRYALSSVAYQGARGLDADAILAECEKRFPVPDLAILLRLDPRQGLARAATRGGSAEPAFEDAAFLAQVAAIYARLDRDYVVRIDAAAAPDAVVAEALGQIEARLGSRLREPVA